MRIRALRCLLAAGILVGVPLHANVVINATFDAVSINAAGAAHGYTLTDVQNGFALAAAAFQNTFTDNVHVNINVNAGAIGLGQSLTHLLGPLTYAQIRTALINDNTAHPSADGTT